MDKNRPKPSTQCFPPLLVTVFITSQAAPQAVALNLELPFTIVKTLQQSSDQVDLVDQVFQLRLGVPFLVGQGGDFFPVSLDSPSELLQLLTALLDLLGGRGWSRLRVFYKGQDKGHRC
jgi:hypothetical protein